MIYLTTVIFDTETYQDVAGVLRLVHSEKKQDISDVKEAWKKFKNRKVSRVVPLDRDLRDFVVWWNDNNDPQLIWVNTFNM